MKKDEHDQLEYRILHKITGMTPLMDWATKSLKQNHRMFGHSIPEILLFASTKAKSPQEFNECFIAGLIHLLADAYSTSTKGEIAHYRRLTNSNFNSNSVPVPLPSKKIKTQKRSHHRNPNSFYPYTPIKGVTTHGNTKKRAKF